MIVGTPDIACKNCLKLGMAKNETIYGTTINQKMKVIVIVVSGGMRDLKIPMTEFNVLFNPAYEITRHKTQRVTFDHAYAIHE